MKAAYSSSVTMLFKCLLIFLAVSSVPNQTAEGQIQDVIAEWNAFLKRVLEIYDGLQESSGLDLGEIIGDLVTVEQLTNAIHFFLDTFEDNLPQEAVCLMRLVLNTDTETQEQVVDLVREVVHYYRLTQQRIELTAECDSYDPNTIVGLIQQQNCRARLQYLNIQIANSNAKIRLQVVAIREVIYEGTSCMIQN